MVGIAFLVAAVVGAGFLVRSVPALPGVLIANGRNAASWEGVHEIVYVAEGHLASVAVSRDSLGNLYYHNAGKVQASSDPADMRLQRMLGHISALAHRKPESVLVVACGAGVTAGSFVVHPDIKRIVICDIEPLVPKFVAPMFEKAPMYKHILIAIENSEADRAVLDHIESLARMTGARLLLVHVADGWAARHFDEFLVLDGSGRAFRPVSDLAAVAATVPDYADIVLRHPSRAR